MSFTYNYKNVDNVEVDVSELDEHLLYFLWKKTKPSLGYNRAYAAELPDGTKFIIEYNFIREAVKIEYYPFDDYKYYYTIIQRGTILQERESQSNRPISLYSKIQKYKNYFGYLIDEQVLKTIGGCYNIPTKSKHPQGTSDFDILQFKQRFLNLKPKNFIKRIQEYLKQKELKQSQLKGIDKIIYRLPGEFFDLSVQTLLFYMFYIGKISSIAFSFYSIFYSIFSGILDIYWRRRNPMLIKTFLFFLPGTIIFWFSYQLKEWGIDEPTNQYLYLLVQLLRKGMNNLL